MSTMKVGEIARRTGVSVRTLHYYEQLGLLVPGRRTAAGHRLYGRDEITRLQQIRSLVQLGFSLSEVRGCLDDPDFSPEGVIRRHIERLDESIQDQQRLRAQLISVAEHLRLSEPVSVDELLGVIRDTTRLDRYYTPEQRRQLEQRAAELGADAIADAERQWAELIAEIRVQMEKGTDPFSSTVRPLAERWRALVEAFTMRDPEIARSLGNVWKHEHANLQRAHGEAVPTPEMFEYISRAMSAM